MLKTLNAAGSGNGLKLRRDEKKHLEINWTPSTVFKIPIPKDEKKRLATLYSYDILDTPPEQTFDSIALLASHVCETPIALLVLIDHDRQWFKAKVGVSLQETPREFSFCTHTIMQRAVLTISDATQDRCFAANPLVVSGRYRFYAGAPLVTPDNRALGTLCVIDRVRRTLTANQKKDLLALSQLVMTELGLRRHLRKERQRNKRTS